MASSTSSTSLDESRRQSQSFPHEQDHRSVVLLPFCLFFLSTFTTAAAHDNDGGFETKKKMEPTMLVVCMTIVDFSHAGCYYCKSQTLEARDYRSPRQHERVPKEC
jgi:hypothetical protein